MPGSHWSPRLGRRPRAHPPARRSGLAVEAHRRGIDTHRPSKLSSSGSARAGRPVPSRCGRTPAAPASTPQAVLGGAALLPWTSPLPARKRNHRRDRVTDQLLIAHRRTPTAGDGRRPVEPESCRRHRTTDGSRRTSRRARCRTRPAWSARAPPPRRGERRAPVSSARRRTSRSRCERRRGTPPVVGHAAERASSSSRSDRRRHVDRVVGTIALGMGSRSSGSAPIRRGWLRPRGGCGPRRTGSPRHRILLPQLGAVVVLVRPPRAVAQPQRISNSVEHRR